MHNFAQWIPSAYSFHLEAEKKNRIMQNYETRENEKKHKQKKMNKLCIDECCLVEKSPFTK